MAVPDELELILFNEALLASTSKDEGTRVSVQVSSSGKQADYSLQLPAEATMPKVKS